MDRDEKTGQAEDQSEIRNLKDELLDTYADNGRIGDSEAWTDFMKNDPLAPELIGRLSSKEVHERAYDSIRGRDKQEEVTSLVRILKRSSRGAGRRSRMLRRIASSAAVLFIAISVGTWYYVRNARHGDFSYITPGEKKAILSYSDGREINLVEAELEIGEDGRLIINGMAETDPVNEAAGGASHHTTLTIPRGGDFFVTLPDKTKVWLNSESVLEFPARFDGNERKVKLRGEAFFDVTANPGKAFVVELPHGRITVYGTRFNVTQYDDTQLKAVLVEGSIGFSPAGGRQVMVEPSQLLTYDSTTGLTELKNVDTEVYTSWIQNLFIFERQSLEDIMSTLSRWYDVDVEFHDQTLKNKVLSGQLNRNEDLGVLLRIYENSTDVRFEIKGKTIHIYRK